MKERIDQLLVEKGLFDTREKAKRAIISGIVHVEGWDSLKPGTRVPQDAKIVVKDKKALFPYVSRGGLKLEKALGEFDISVKNKIALDIGASTGGFTDCLLQFGAKLVYAVDVGYGQLDWKLRNNPKVLVRERVNARYLSREVVDEDIDIVTIDVSFISLNKILPAILFALKEKGDIVALIKPQFEAGKEEVKKGIIRDPSIHKRVIEDIVSAAEDIGLYLYGLTWSPIKGPKGNIEFLAWFKRGIEGTLNIEDMVEKVVKEAHAQLG